MPNMHRCFLVLSLALGLTQAAELVQPNPANCELLVNDFSQLQSTTQNNMGFDMKLAGGMQTTVATDGDPRLILTPNTNSSFWFSFVRKAGQCFDANNFDFISVELKSTPDIQFLIGYSSNDIHCDEAAESVVRYSLVLINNKKGTGEKTTVDIPFSSISGEASKNNMYAITIGGLTMPLELYSVTFKGSCATGVSSETIVSVRDQTATTDSDSESDKEETKECSLAIEDFANEDINENVLRGTHGSDGTMSNEKYSAIEGLQITSKTSESYWYTVIPCMKFKHYNMLALNVAGPTGGDFSIRLKTKEGCEQDFKDFVLTASELLDGKLGGEPQQVLIPFDKLNGFNKTKHTISSIVVGDFQNEGETHDSANPMTLNIKSISLRGENCDEDDEDDTDEEHIQAKENPSDAQDREDDMDSTFSSTSKATISFVAIALVALFISV